MKSPEGIRKFIEYKQSIEKEHLFLTAEQNLITIDGVNGENLLKNCKNVSTKRNNRQNNTSNLCHTPVKRKL